MGAPLSAWSVRRPSPYTIRTDNAPKVRIWATVGEEPEVELALGQRFGTLALLMTLRASRRSRNFAKKVPKNGPCRMHSGSSTSMIHKYLPR